MTVVLIIRMAMVDRWPLLSFHEACHISFHLIFMTEHVTSFVIDIEVHGVVIDT